METWENEIKEAVAAGEREFGRLDAHQTVKHNLMPRCAEILAEQAQSNHVEERSGAWAEGAQP